MSNSIIYFQDYKDSNNDISVISADNYSLTHFDGSARSPDGQSVTNLTPGTWLHYSSKIPTGEFASCMLFASTLNGNQKVEIRVGTPDITPLWVFTITPVSLDQYFTESVSGAVNFDITEEQDIYFHFPDGFTGYLNWFVFCQNSGTETQEHKLHRMQWFNNARFGHMIHWGAYSVLGRGEWVMHDESIPKDEYIQEACIPFNPQSYDPDYWAYIIESTGQKYVTITTKHHDGFAMFDTNVDEFAPYDVENTASVHASVLRPFADTCRTRGIKFCCYYSWLDWGNVNEVAIEAGAVDVPPDINPDDVTRYLSEMKEHLKELIEIFDPELIWFDGSWAAFIDSSVSQEIGAFLRRLSPDIIINDRIGNSAGDFTTSEQSMPAGTQTSLWEACMTINDSWGYDSNDTNWKSIQTLLNNLLDCASKGGNLLLNTGPTGDGVIPSACISRLNELGLWMKTWGAAIYNTRAGTLDVSAQPGAWCTVGKDNTLYVTVTEIPDDYLLRIELPVTLPENAYWLNTPEMSVEYRTENGLLIFDLPETLSDALGMVLAVEFGELPEARMYPDHALFRSAASDSIWGGNTSEYGAQNVTDGNDTTRWASDQTSNVTLTLNLGAGERFDRISLRQYEQRIGDFRLEAFNSGISQAVITGSGPAQNYQAYLPEMVTADTLILTIISCLGDDPASLFTVSLYNTADTLWPVNQPINLAQGATTSSSSVWFDDEQDYSASYATDGNTSTRWASSDNPALPLSLTVNFLKNETFDLIRIKEDTYADGSSRVAAFTLQVQDENGTSWNDILTGTDISQPVILPYLTVSTAVRMVITALTGTGGPSFYEFAVYQTARQLTPLEDDELLEAEARLCFEYLWREANLSEGHAGFGLVADTRGGRTASIACSGFALSGLVIAAERGWISQDMAENRCQESLKVILNNVPQYNGFLYHFIDMDNPADSHGSEYSTVDTMLALNGILTAGQYFGGDCASLAQQIFDRVDWQSALSPNGYFTMSWDDDFNMNTSTWGGYAEQFCMYPMALGSSTHAPAQGADIFYSLERKYGHYADSGDLIYVWDGSLFTYQFSHAWLDFRRLWDRQGADWWQNSVNAGIANRQFCIANHDVFPSLGQNNWGLTACHGPDGYKAFGAPPSGNIDANNQHYTDGTVSPSGPIGNLPFAPQDVLKAMNEWYQNPRLWTGYGFTESFNTSNAAPWYCPTNSGLIKGLTLMMIENYRSGLIWDTYMSHPVLKAGLPIIFDNQQPEILIQDNDPAIVYNNTSQWWRAGDREESTDGYSMVVENNGDYFEFTFNGRNVSYYGERSTDQGDIDFYIDGEYHGTASAYGTSHTYSDIIYAITDLEPVTHVLKGIKRSGKWMTLDALKIYASNTFDAVISAVDAAGDMATVELNLTQAADRETATDVTSWVLDKNAVVTSVILSTDKKTVSLQITGIQDGETYSLITDSVTNEILSEALNKRVLSFTCKVLPPERVYDDNDEELIYTGSGWWRATGRSGSIFSSSSMVTGTNGDSCRLSFTGTGIAYYSETNSDQGNIEIFIDGNSVGIFSTYSETHHDSGIIYLNNYLSFGEHIFECVKRSGTWMLLDALKVYNAGDISLLKASTDSEDNIILTFNQALDENQAEDTSHYTLDENATITQASIDPQKYTVTLSTNNLIVNDTYRLNIDGVSNELGNNIIDNMDVEIEVREGLANWYAFDDLSDGIVTDSVTGSTDAVIMGQVATTDGKSGTGCQLSSGGYISLGGMDLFQQRFFTIEAWIKPENITGDAAIISQEMSGNKADRMRMYYNGNQLHFSYSADNNTAGIDIPTKGYIADGEWSHVAVIRDDSNFYIAINGNILCSTSNNIVQNNTLPVWIGARMTQNGTDCHFTGEMDEIKFYECAVTPDKLVEHYRILADDNYSMVVTNGTVIVTFMQAQPQQPSVDNFHCWITINDEMKTGLSVSAFSWDEADLKATLTFPVIPDAAVDQNITITVQYNELPTKATLQLPAVSIAPPVITSLVLDGVCKTRETLTAIFTVEDPAGFTENGSKCTWWVGETIEGEFEQIAGVSSLSMMLLPEHAGKYIRIGVTPRNERFAEGRTTFAVTSQPVEQQEGNPRTDWFMNARYGISNHFLPNYQNLSPAIPDDEKWQPGESWDDFLSTFDVDAYASAVADLGAGFVMLTIDQHSGYNLAPSSVYDSILDLDPGVRSPSQRDLPKEIALALGSYGIKLICYFMGTPPGKASLVYYDDDASPHSPDRWGDMLVTRTFEMGPFSDIKTRESTRMHAAVVRDFGEHYGDLLAGFWFDGMYDTSWFNDMSEEYNITTLIDGARAGNPNRIVTGAGMGGSVYMDYPHGESYGARDENGNEYMDEYPASRWENNDGYHQWFRWIALGDVSINAGWGVPTNSADGHHYDTDKLVSWVKQATDLQGVISMDVRVNRFGVLDTFATEQLTAVKAAVWPEEK